MPIPYSASPGWYFYDESRRPKLAVVPTPLRSGPHPIYFSVQVHVKGYGWSELNGHPNSPQPFFTMEDAMAFAVAEATR